MTPDERKESARRSQKKWLAANRDQLLAKQRAKYAANPSVAEAARERQKAWREKNRDRNRKRARVWQGKDKPRAKNQAYKNAYGITLAERDAMLADQ